MAAELGDTARQCLMVRMVKVSPQHVTYTVFKLKKREACQHWKFEHGVAVIGYSLSDLLEDAATMLQIKSLKTEL